MSTLKDGGFAVNLIKNCKTALDDCGDKKTIRRRKKFVKANAVKTNSPLKIALKPLFSPHHFGSGIFFTS